MLDKIKYKGFEVVSSQFTEHKDSEGGRYNVSLNGCEFSSGYNEQESKSWAQLIIEPCVQGYEDSAYDQQEEPDAEGLAFEVNMKIYVFFDIEGRELITEAFFNENTWFFENFMAVSLKLAIESVLKNTPLNTISLPWSVPSVSPLKTDMKEK